MLAPDPELSPEISVTLYNRTDFVPMFFRCRRSCPGHVLGSCARKVSAGYFIVTDMSTLEQYWKYSLIAIILVLGVILFIEFTPFFGGILGAFTIYILVRNHMLYLTEVKRFRRSWVAVIILCESILCFLIPLSLAVWLFVHKLQNVNLDPEMYIHSVERFASLIEDKVGYNFLDRNNLASIASALPRVGQVVMGSITSFAINILVLIFVLYFMVIGGREMESYIYELLPFNQHNKKIVLCEINMLVKSNAIGIPLLAVTQGVVAMIGYIIFKAPDPVLFGFLSCIATIIPIVGTGLVWLPLALYMGLSGHWGHALGVVLYGVLIISNVDNFIRFILQKKLADTHPLITIFGVIIGLSMFGFMGVIFGPLLLSIFLLCVNMFKKEYIDRKNTRTSDGVLIIEKKKE